MSNRIFDFKDKSALETITESAKVSERIGIRIDSIKEARNRIKLVEHILVLRKNRGLINSIKFMFYGLMPILYGRFEEVAMLLLLSMNGYTFEIIGEEPVIWCNPRERGKVIELRYN
jgi:hypothetical protein